MQGDYDELDPDRPSSIGAVFSGKYGPTNNMEAGLAMCQKIRKE